MSASFPEMAFWVIFPLAALIVISGWAIILTNAVKKLRARKGPEENPPASVPAPEEPVIPAPNWPVDDSASWIPLQ